MRRPKPHQLVLAVGVARRARHARLGHRPDDHALGRPLDASSGPCSSTSRAAVAGVLRRRRRRCCSSPRGSSSLRVRNYERGRPDDRRTTKKNAKRRLDDFRAGVWMQTLLRDPAAGAHALVHLLRLPRPVHRDGDPRDRPPAARVVKFLHGGTYQAYSAGADLAGVRLPRRHRAGRSVAATCSGRTASASRPSPKTP